MSHTERIANVTGDPMPQPRRIILPALFAALATASAIASCADSGEQASNARAPQEGLQVDPPAAPVPPGPIELKGRVPDLVAEEGEPSVSTIDAHLKRYREVRIAVLSGIDGEVFPCGCTDGQIGGLVGLMPKLRAQRPDVVVSLGDNYTPRALPVDVINRSRDYFARRMAFVRSAISDPMEVVELLSPRESELAESAAQDSAALKRRLVIAGHNVDLYLSRTETWTRAEPQERRGQSLLLLTGERFQQGASFEGINRALWVRTPMDTAGFPENLSLVARPPSGARGMIMLSILVPEGPSKPGSVAFLDEVRTLRTAIIRSLPQGESSAGMRERLDQRAVKLLESRPTLIHLQQISVTADDPVDHELYRAYSRFLAEHGSGRALEAAEGSNSKCASCHADYVKAFEAHDPHFHAIDPLRKAGKANDPFCASCHITPLTINSERAMPSQPQFVEGVQCQWCHQAAERHASSPYRIKPSTVTSEMCETCHNDNQSPTYVWDQYLRRVSCYVVKQGE